MRFRIGDSTTSGYLRMCTEYFRGPRNLKCRKLGRTTHEVLRTLICYLEGTVYCSLFCNCGADPQMQDSDYKQPPRQYMQNICEMCGTLATIPFLYCMLCGDNPSYHHSRCCPCRSFARVPFEYCGWCGFLTTTRRCQCPDNRTSDGGH